jgi:S-adenosylmethionine:tRNA ribosyltransferase-isomerase
MADFKYELPEKLIAQIPLANRDASKLLVYKEGNISETKFSELVNVLPEGSLLVFNNTKVLKARLFFRKETGAEIELLLLEPYEPSQYAASLSSSKECMWKCMAGNLKKWKEGPVYTHVVSGGSTIKLKAEKRAVNGNILTVRFSWDTDIKFGELIGAGGHIPLPPYISRSDNEYDSVRYQTVYSREEGSVAAPTAGLHFTEEIMKKLKTEKGIKTVDLTLHVGAGTFLPVKSEYISGHQMHTEHYSFTSDFVGKLRGNAGKVIAVGTTSARAIESIYWLGTQLLEHGETPDKMYTGQWDPYRPGDIPETEESLKAVEEYMLKNRLESISASTSLLIVPGYRFRITKGLITNFHQPGSTLLLLVSAFTGNRWREIYRFAKENEFRFLSYGDSSLLLP